MQVVLTNYTCREQRGVAFDTNSLNCLGRPLQGFFTYQARSRHYKSEVKYYKNDPTNSKTLASITFHYNNNVSEPNESRPVLFLSLRFLLNLSLHLSLSVCLSLSLSLSTPPLIIVCILSLQITRVSAYLSLLHTSSLSSLCLYPFQTYHSPQIHSCAQDLYLAH